jgi:hypothetical protein
VPLYWYSESTHEFTPVEEPSPYVSYYYQVPSTETYFTYEPTPVQWTSYYYAPTTQLFTYEPNTNSYFAESEPSPYQEYSFYNEVTRSYQPYEPTPVVWTDFYETPSVPLYTYDAVYCNYQVESEPSPFEEYSYYYEPTQSYVAYIPSAPVWTDYYEQSTSPLYSWNEYSEAYESSSSPNPYWSYYTFSEATGTYNSYEPTPARWTNYYGVPSVDLYSYDESTNSYFVESEPSPYQTYYVWNSGTVLTYEPSPISPPEPWTNYYEVPSVSLYSYEECTDSYAPVNEPSPSEHYFYQSENSYVPYEPSAP